MKLADHLSNKQKQQLKKVKSPEKVDWKEIMGMKRDTYKRVRGAVRRR